MARREVKLILWVDVYLHYRSPMILRSTIIDHHFRIVRGSRRADRYFSYRSFESLSLSLNLQRFTDILLEKFLLETFNVQILQNTIQWRAIPRLIN